MLHDDDDELLSLGEFARLLKLSPEASRRLVDRGDVPSMRLSNGYRVIRRHDAERLAAQRRARSRTK